MSRSLCCRILVGSVFACLMWALPAQAQSQPFPQDVPCALFPQPQRFNTQTSDDGVVSIGRLPNRPYRLAFINASEAEVRSLRACVLDAFETRSRLGKYLLVGSFARRREAERVRRTLRREGFETRVIYAR